jgi:hypothetical protein
MKSTPLLIAIGSLLGAVHGEVLDWQIQNLVDFTSYSPEGISRLSFTFDNPNTGVITSCSYFNSPGSGQSPTVLTFTPCEDANVRFTYRINWHIRPPFAIRPPRI